MIAVGTVRREDLLIVVIAPPVIFLGAVTCAELITGHEDHGAGAVAVAAGILLTLAGAAVWMFGGLAGALVIALVRGLPQCVRDLRAGLNAGSRLTGGSELTADRGQTGDSPLAGDGAPRPASQDYRSARRSS